jgi:hypothetical protein
MGDSPRPRAWVLLGGNSVLIGTAAFLFLRGEYGSGAFVLGIAGSFIAPYVFSVLRKSGRASEEVFILQDPKAQGMVINAVMDRGMNVICWTSLEHANEFITRSGLRELVPVSMRVEDVRARVEAVNKRHGTAGAVRIIEGVEYDEPPDGDQPPKGIAGSVRLFATTGASKRAPPDFDCSLHGKPAVMFVCPHPSRATELVIRIKTGPRSAPLVYLCAECVERFKAISDAATHAQFNDSLQRICEACRA